MLGSFAPSAVEAVKCSEWVWNQENKWYDRGAAIVFIPGVELHTIRVVACLPETNSNPLRRCEKVDEETAPCENSAREIVGELLEIYGHGIPIYKRILITQAKSAKPMKYTQKGYDSRNKPIFGWVSSAAKPAVYRWRLVTPDLERRVIGKKGLLSGEFSIQH